MRITHVVVHYTATFEDQMLTAADIDKMHRQRGWKMIGYHYIIRRDGTVEPGRPETMVGAHVAGQNTGKIGVSWIGGLDRATGPNKGVDNRTPAQTEALIKLIRSLLKKYPGAKVVGHRDLASTQCPGFDVQTWWAKVQKKKTPDNPVDVSKAPAKSPNLGEQKTHRVAKGDTWWSVSQLYGMPLDDLLRANEAQSSDRLLIGRDLSLVAPPKIAASSKDWGKPIAKPAPAKSGLAAFIAAILKMFGKGSK